MQASKHYYKVFPDKKNGGKPLAYVFTKTQ